MPLIIWQIANNGFPSSPAQTELHSPESHQVSVQPAPSLSFLPPLVGGACRVSGRAELLPLRNLRASPVLQQCRFLGTGLLPAVVSGLC